MVAKEGEWGGNWTSQYEFVRLHQPYRGFTAGARAWSLDRYGTMHHPKHPTASAFFVLTRGA